MEIQVPGFIVSRLIPADCDPLRQSLTVRSGERESPLIQVDPTKLIGLVVDTDIPVEVCVGEASFAVGPLPLVWTRTANQGKAICSGSGRVEIEIANAGESDANVRIAVCHS